MIGLTEIQGILPHREPFLFIDEIKELIPGKKAIGLKRVTGEEYFFKGHFPSYPIMPGVLIIEALAQTGACAILCQPENKGKIGYLAGLESVRFKRKVVPGDVLTLSVEIDKFKLGIGTGKAAASVDGDSAVTAVIKFAIGDPNV